MRIRPVDRWVGAGLVLGTALLGAARADDHPFWVDEAFTATVTHRSFGDLVHTLAHEAGMVPFYVALWCWQLLGRSEWWLRELSVIGGALAVGALYLLVVHAAGRRAAVVATAMMLANPAFLYQLTELRTYSWVIFLSSASTLVFLRLRTSPTPRRAIIYGVLVGLLVSSLMFAVAIPLTHLCIALPLAKNRAGRRSLAIATGVAFVVMLPALPALLTSDQLSWIRPLSGHRTRMQYQLSLGSNLWAVAILLGVVLLLCTLALDLRANERRPDPTMWMLAAAPAVGPVVLILISLRQGVFISRYLAGTLPLAIAASAIGFVRAADRLTPRLAGRARYVMPAAAVVACAVAFDGNPLDDIPRPEDLRSPSLEIIAHADADTAVVFDKALEGVAFDYYLPDEPWTKFGPGQPPAARPLSDYCHIWWVSRVPVAELAEDTGRPLDDLTLLQFHGVALAELDACDDGGADATP